MTTNQRMFSQRHYKAIAALLYRRTDTKSSGHWVDLVNDFTYMLSQDSEFFDEDKFRAACTGKKEKASV